MILIRYEIHIWFEYFPINFICNVLWMFKAVQRVGLTQKKSVFFPQGVCVSYYSSSSTQKTIISHCSIYWLVFLMKAHSVICETRKEYIMYINSVLQSFKEKSDQSLVALDLLYWWLHTVNWKEKVLAYSKNVSQKSSGTTKSTQVFVTCHLLYRKKFFDIVRISVRHRVAISKC
jgi:hypothetical protein